MPRPQISPLPSFSRSHWAMLLLILAMLAILLVPGTQTSASRVTPSFDAAHDLTASEWSGILSGIRQAEYQFTWNGTTEAYQASNPAQRFDVAVKTGTVEIVDQHPTPEWRLSLALAGYGRAGAVQPPVQPALSAQREQLLTQWNPQFTESLSNLETGLAHQFTLLTPQETLQIDLALTTPLIPNLSVDRQTLFLQTPNGKTILRYDLLPAADAHGDHFPAHFLLTQTEGHPQLSLLADTGQATFPFTVSLLLHDQIAKLLATDGEVDDEFGFSVALSGDTAVVGAYRDDDIPTGSGAAYVFARNQEGADAWGQVLKLTAEDADAGDLFGWSVAISGDIVAIGAKDDEDLGTTSGSVYIFARNQNGSNNWGQVKKILASDGTESDQFGYAVALDGDTLLVGAPNKDGPQGGDVGEVYLFQRNLGGADNWGEITHLTPNDAETNQQFGFSVGISGEMVIVGSYLDDGAGGVYQGSAYLFARNQDGADAWGFVKKIFASDGQSADTYGYSVAISGGVAVVGARFNNPGAGFAQGAAYVYERNWGGPNNWGQFKKLVAEDGVSGDIFGDAVAIDGDTIVIGAASDDASAGADQGAVYVFRRNEGGADNWGQNAKLQPVDASPADRFGDAVAVSGSTILGGAPFVDDAGGQDQGAAYIFVDQDYTWEQSAKPTANDGNATDAFGYSVAVSGDFLVVGSRFDDTTATDTGSAYLFERNSDGAGGQDADDWGYVKKLTASDANANDQFGWAVTISGNTLAVSANLDDGAGSNAGAVYIFSQNQGGADNWGQVQKITAQGASAEEQFGYALSLSQDILLVGAPYRDGGAGTDQGTAYLFSRNQGGADHWGQITELIPSLTGANDQFGFSVSLSGGFAAVGAPYADTPLADQGAGFVFQRNLGGADAWGQAAVVLANDAEANDTFGYSLALSGETLAVGSPFDDDTAGADQGSVSVFARNAGGGDTWGFVKRVVPEDPAANDQFGFSVALDGGTLVAGASGNDDFGDASGALYVFERNRTGANVWGQLLKLAALDAQAGDGFGKSVSVSGKNIASGAPGEDQLGNDAGAAYVFQTEIYVTPPPPATSTPTLTPTETATLTPTPTGPTPTPSPTFPPPPGDERLYLPLVRFIYPLP